jgi:hypothetical protein
MIERLALETGEWATCPCPRVKPIRAAVESRRERLKAGASRMAASGAKRTLGRDHGQGSARVDQDNSGTGCEGDRCAIGPARTAASRTDGSGDALAAVTS